MQGWRRAGRKPLVKKPLRSHDDYPYHHTVARVAVGALPDGAPVIVTGGLSDGMGRVWRLADGAPVGNPLGSHDGDPKVAREEVGAQQDGNPGYSSGDGNEPPLR